MDMDLPRISIITVTYNCELSLQSTIDSIISQTYDNKEYIIIDGQSSDSTVDIIKSNAENLSIWISEPDNGIYDAMNKGINLATGDYICFINSGDSFYNSRVLEIIAAYLSDEVDILYGNTNLIFNFGAYVEKAGVANLQNYMPFYHQASFVRTNIMQKYMFDTKYKLCGDRNFFYLAFRSGYKFRLIDHIICNYESESGVSSVNAPLLLREIGKLENKSLQPSWIIDYNLFLVRYRLKNLIKTILPKKVVVHIRERNLKHKLR